MIPWVMCQSVPPSFWATQTKRSLERSSIGMEIIPRETISACAILKKARPTRIMTIGARIVNTKHMMCHHLNH